MVDHCFAYVIYGDDDKYTLPVFESYRRLSESNLDFEILIFCDNFSGVKSKYSTLNKVRLCRIPPFFIPVPRLVRFLASDFSDACFFHFRDSDSIVTDLEIFIADFIFRSGEIGCLIRNHNLHFAPMLAGLFSLDQSNANLLAGMVRNGDFTQNAYYDQIFLSRYIYPKLREHFMVFSSHYYYYGERVSKISFDCDDFCGRPVDYVSKLADEKFPKLKRLIFVPGFHRFFQSPRFVKFFGYMVFWL